jgi:hypothetical protein
VPATPYVPVFAVSPLTKKTNGPGDNDTFAPTIGGGAAETETLAVAVAVWLLVDVTVITTLAVVAGAV